MVGGGGHPCRASPAFAESSAPLGLRSWGVLFSAAFPIAHFDTGRRLFAHELTPRRPFRKRSGSVRTRRELRAVRANANDAYVDALVDRVCVVTPSDVVAKYEAANRPRADGR